MPNLIDRAQEQRFIALFVGRSGTGKTVAEASFPKPIHFDDFDGRIGGAQVPWLDQKDIDYTFWSPKMEGLVTKLNKHLEMYLNTSLLGRFGSVPNTYICDSITNLTYALISASIKLTHFKKNPAGKIEQSGRWFEAVAVEGPEDYKLEATGTYDYVAFLKSIPIANVIVSAHYVDLYGKAETVNNKGEVVTDTYGPSIVVGKKLSIRDKIGENVQTSFDHIFEFERDVDRYYVKFRGELARTSYSWLPSGRQEWTGKNFYEFMMSFKAKATTTTGVK